MLILIKNPKYEERREKMIEEFETDSQSLLPPGIGAGFESEYINGIGRLKNNLPLLTGCEKFLIKEELSKIKNIA